MPSAARHLNPSEKLDWLRLIRSENVGPVGLMEQPPLGGLEPIMRTDVPRGVIVNLPRAARSTEGDSATFLEIVRGRLREGICRALNRPGMPGAIRDAEISDALTGQQVSVRVGHLFVRISLNGRDYYFDRLTGRFGGTGSGCA